MQNDPATQLAAFPSAWIHKTYFLKLSGENLAPWDIEKDPLTPYQQQLKEALREYHSNIPDPKEWSQEYPMFCNQIMEDTQAPKDMHEDKPPDDLKK
ncbi:hypothetical protein Gohar_011306 [Gossypium harknessii]|uniref:Uncharacterized protein n=1 Tax=Gossypium harknessii TaxID=34285 RepID=A0A7J9GUA7_9ROSI|nr:hypothetical protein [Gossypium harknessii]